MTPQEQQLLTQLTQRINQTQLEEKDPDAENLLGRELGANPDALYILAQTVLVQNIALDQAKAQIAQLQQQAQQPRQPAHATSFLGRLLGDHDPNPAPQQQPPPFQPVPPQYAQQVPPPYAQPVPPQYAPQGFVPVPSGPPSFLRGAAQTAAGVAAGALAFEGVESILHGFGHGGMGFGGPGMGMAGMGMGPGMGLGGGFERPIEETVVNNYYDGPGGQGEHRGIESTGSEPHFHESADQSGDQGRARFSDASYNTTGNDDSSSNDQGGFDDNNSDDSSNFDNGGQDDGGVGFDDGGGFDGGDSGGGGDLI